jgi:peptide/nickel transport system substrate-binding protein
MPASRARASLCTVAVFAAVLTACTGDAARGGAGAPLELRIGTVTMKGATSNGVSTLSGILSAEPLVSIAWDGHAVFKLAESVSESPDGLLLTVKLRPNVKFHSGEPVTAALVRELLWPQLAKRSKEVAELTTVDDRSLTFRLHRPYSFKDVDLNDFTIDDPTRLELRTGPFRIVSSDPITVLAAFPGYYDGASAVGRVEIHEYPTHRAAWSAMLRNEVNFLHEVNRDAIDFIQAGGDTRAYPLLRPYYVPLVFNQKHPILRRREVRVAITEAIDRDEVVRNGMRGNGIPAEGPFWPYHWAYPQGRHTQAAYNPEAAKVRLEGTGLPVTRRGPREMPSRFGFTCLLLAGDTRFERIALVVQRELLTIGVDMQLRVLPFKEFISRVTAGDFDSFIFELASGRSLSFPYKFWHSGNAQVPTGYSAADEALERMKLARTEDEVRVAVSDVMRVMLADPPAVFLAFPREVRAADRSIDIPYEKDRDVLGSIWQVRRGPALARRAE